MIPLFKVFHPEGIGQKIEELFRAGQITEGVHSDEFETKLGAYVGNPYTALVNSCTSALTLAYRMCDVRHGDEVITTPMTCMATNEPIITAGGHIVWADVDQTGNIDPSKLLSLATKRTKAIVAVHWAGQPFDIDAVNAVARSLKIPVIADAAHALGATYKGKPIATQCDYTCFSFQAIKHLTTADGGAISARNKLAYEKLKLLRWFGIDRKWPGPKWEQDIVECGYKFHMNNLNALIGLEQMKHIDWIVAMHKRNGRFFDENINDSSFLTKIKRNPNSESAHWIYSILVENPQKFKQYMFDAGITVDAVHVRNDHYSVFNAYRADSRLPGVSAFASRLMNIPVGWWLTNDELNKIVEVVNAYKA